MSNLSSLKPAPAAHINLPKASKFNNLPSFIKAGFTHYQKYQNVRKQSFYQRIAVCELLKAKANNIFLEENYSGAISEYEQVTYFPTNSYLLLIGSFHLSIHFLQESKSQATKFYL